MSTTEDRKDALEVYELGYLVLPSIPEDKLPDTVNSIKSIIKKAGAEEVDSEDPIKQNLAYSMSKVLGASRYVVNDAYIGWIKFEVTPSAVKEIADAVSKIDEILRSLVIKAPRETYFTFAQAIEAKKAEEVALSEEEDSVDVSETEEVLPADEEESSVI